MEGYQERMARRIRREAAQRGESALDLAQAVGVYPTTAERWFRGERLPQRRHRKELAEHWELPLDSFEFDLEAEESEVRDQLDRIEAMLEQLLAEAGLPIAPAADENGPSPEAAEQAMEDEAKRLHGREGSKRANGTAEAGG